MRVIAGKYRSRNLQTLPGDDTRPTYDRLRETLFNVLTSANVLEDAIFVDLFAGTGSIGIEALSRGASHVYFAESSRKAAQLIRTNLESLEIREEADIFERSAVELLRFLSDSEIRPTLIFLDPPYKSQGSYGQVLRVISQSNVLAEAGIVIAEHEKRFDPGEQEGSLKRYRKLNQGESSLSFYRMEANAREELSPSEQMLE